MCGLKQHDQSTADFNPSFLQKKVKPATACKKVDVIYQQRGLAPQGIGTLRRPNIFKRTFKAVRLFCKTRYSWATSWAQAGCDYDYR